MESLTHGLIGVALAGIALGSPEIATATERGIVIGTIVVASQLPDADVVYRLGGKWAYLENHRGWSHSFPVSFAAGAALAAAVAYFTNLSFWFLLLYCWLGVGLHLLTDFTNSFGTQALIPWRRWRIAWDIVPTFDPVIVGILLLGWGAWGLNLLSPRAAGLVSLGLVAVWVLVRLSFRGKASVLAQGTKLQLMSIIPTIKPWTWRFVASGQWHQVIQGEVNLVPREVVELARLNASAEAPLIELLRNSREGSIFLNHSRHPHVELFQQTREGTSVLRVTDLAGQQASAEVEVKGHPQ